MIAALQTVDNMINPLRKLANCVAAPLFDLAARLYLGHEFFKSTQRQTQTGFHWIPFAGS